MKRIYLSRKRKQLSALSSRLAYLLKNRLQFPLSELRKLKEKITRLLTELKYFFSLKELKLVLGSVAFLFFSSGINQPFAQDFNPPQENPFGLSSTSNYSFPSFVDLDDDGDYDLLVGEADQDIFDYYVGNFQYFENVGTNTEPDYLSPVENPFWLYPTDFWAILKTVDLDNDGDIDVFVGEANGDMIYIENVGTASEPDFWAPLENPFGLTSRQFIATPSFADLDNDGDFDLIVGEYSYNYSTYDPEGQFQYFENIGTAYSPEFADPLLNPFGLSSIGVVAAPEFVDLDGDGDFDLIAGEYFNNSANNSEDGRFQYFENTGSESEPEFADPIANPFGLESLFYYAFPSFADLDDDGDLDLIAGEYQGALNYFENIQIVGIEENRTRIAFSIYPNPAQDFITIKSTNEIETIEITDLIGKSIRLENSVNTQVNIEDLSPGIYSLKIKLKNGNVGIQSFIKN